MGNSLKIRKFTLASFFAIFRQKWQDLKVFFFISRDRFYSTSMLVTEFMKSYELSPISSKLTWNIVDGDKWALFPLVLDKRPDWKCKHRNKLVRTNFLWMVNCFQFVSTHMIQLYWIGYIPVFRPVPVVPLGKPLYRQNMLQFHRQDWNQCPWFDDLKIEWRKMVLMASFHFF